MTDKKLAEFVILLELTLVSQTVFKKNFFALIQQKRQGHVLQTYSHCLIPKLFFNAIASLPEKTTEPPEPTEPPIRGTLTSKSFVTISKSWHVIITWRPWTNFVSLRLPLFEKQLGIYQALENLADMWGIKSTLCFKNYQPQFDTASLPLTPAVDPSPSLRPSSNYFLFAWSNENNSTALCNGNQNDISFFSAALFQTPELSTGICFGCLRHIKVIQGSKKRLTENSLVDLFEKKLDNKTWWLTSKKAKLFFIKIDDYEEILNKTRRSSPGPEKISYNILKRLPKCLKAYICLLITSSINNSYVPTTWKESQVKMLPKPNKNKKDAENYRPISLTNYIAKICETAVKKICPSALWSKWRLRWNAKCV